MQTNAELLNTLLNIVTDNIYVNNPCQVVNVSSDGNFVDVKIFINDEDEDCVLYNVPVQRPETHRAYIFLGIQKGDRGTLKFFDRSTEGYRQNDYDYNSDERQHDINDSCFELGFFPDNQVFIYPNNVDIEIGMKDSSAKISFGQGLMGENITIECSGRINIKNFTQNLGDLMAELITLIAAIKIENDAVSENIKAKLETVAAKFAELLETSPTE